MTFGAVWSRIESHAGEAFRRKQGGEFTYAVADDRLLLHRSNRPLPRSNFATAYERMPVAGPSQLKDLLGWPYVYAILADDRIRHYAIRCDWQVKRMRLSRRLNPPVVRYTEQEWRFIRVGLIPLEMEDRWFAYCVGDSLHLFRSWTGLPVFVVDFDAESNPVAIESVVVNDAKSSVVAGKTDDEVREMLVDAITSVILTGDTALAPSPDAFVIGMPLDGPAGRSRGVSIL